MEEIYDLLEIDIISLEEKAEEHFTNGQFKESIGCFSELLNFYKSNPDKTKIALLEKQLGKCFFYLADYTKSVEHYLQALINYEELGDIQNISECNYSLGTAYAHRGEIDKCSEYFTVALSGFTKSNSYEDLAKIHNAFGVIHINTGKLDDAYYHLSESLNYAVKADNTQAISNATSNLGLIHMEKKEFDKALDNFHTSLSLEEKLDSKRGIAYVNFRIAEAYMWKKDYDKSLEVANISLEMQKSMENTYQVSNCYLLISSIYEEMENYKEALKYYKLYTSTQMQIYTEDNNKKVSELQKDYDLYKQEKEKEIYRLRNEELVEMNNKLKLAYDEIHRISTTDPLTGLLNRRGFTEFIDKSLPHWYENNNINSLLLLDLDNFKLINDTYGHSAGDIILKKTSEIISKVSNNLGICARWGGEELIVFLPNLNENEAVDVSNKIRLALSSVSFLFDNKAFSATVTIGISCGVNMSLEEHFEIADRNLYLGKKSGKNCVIV